MSTQTTTSTLSAILSSNTSELAALIEKRKQVARTTIGEGLRSLFEENPDLFLIQRVRSDSYDDNTYYGQHERSFRSTLAINGESDDYMDYRSSYGRTPRAGYEAQAALHKAVQQFFNVSDDQIDEAFGGWAEIKASWNRRTNSVDVAFLQ